MYLDSPWVFVRCMFFAMQSALFPLSDPVVPVPEAELVAFLARAVAETRSGRMTREAEAYLAGVCAEALVDRLVLAGLVVVRK